MKIYLTYRERIAGFFMLFSLALVTLFVIGAAIENLWFTPKVNYHVYVVRGEGLTIGAPVLLSGINIGRIGDLTIMKDGRINVKLSVLKEHSHRIIKGTRARVRRTMGIGEKRIHLTLPEKELGAKKISAFPESLPPGASLPIDEPRDIMDIVSDLDLGRYMDVMERAVSSLDNLLITLEKDDRMTRMIEAFDTLGPTLKIMHSFFTEIHDPFINVISEPSVVNAFQGADKIFNDKKTIKLIHVLNKTLTDEKLTRILAKSEQLIDSFNTVLKDDGHMNQTFKGMDKIINSGKMDNLIDALDRMSNEEKMERLVHNFTVLSTQMAKIGPEIPTMAKGLNSTMRELSIVLKALQKSWLLDDETREVLKEIKGKK